MNQTIRADLLCQLLALLLGANVAPDQRRTDHAVLLVEHDRAMHLAGEPDAGDFIRGDAGAAQGFANRNRAGAPPVFGLLFCPADLWGREGRVLFCRGCEHAALLIDDEGACAAGANVNAE